MPATPLPGLLGAVAPVLDNYGYLAVAGLVMVENFGVPAPGETILVAASVYAGTGRLSIVAVGVIAVLAAVAGNCIGYAIGYFGGHALVLRFGKYVFLTRERWDKAERFFARRGGLVVVAGRFIEGLRQVAGLIAGTAEMPFKRFLFFTTLGAVLWVGVWAPVGYLAGDHIGTIYATATRYSLYLLIALVLLLAGWLVRAFLRRKRGRAPDVSATKTERGRAQSGGGREARGREKQSGGGRRAGAGAKRGGGTRTARGRDKNSAGAGEGEE